ncbi:glycoside hydrolase family 88/105 protein [Sphingomonas sp. HT-1]|uniref:glycoside hydrolase family 88/105 protein n=1 Tax=unclassified Sphingomonas TaxID=196159 RepID=UPI0002D64250|nr:MULTISPECIES: glycoside hydrolase family 88 protein [unclassified Sphingomonas]KTF70678.1 glycosyl hydrolase family 88 [Sphingomonas sp. WG]
MKYLALASIFLAAAPGAVQAQRPAATRPASSAIEAAVRLADWQLGQMQGNTVSRMTGETRNPRAWEQAAFWIGMTALADAGGPPRIRKAILDMGTANRWLPGDNPYFADDHAITQAYLWAARNGAGEAARIPARRTFDRVVNQPAIASLAFYVPPEGYGAAECLKRWCWCDALFMAPAALAELSLQTGDPRYRDFAMDEFWATTDFLYDPAQRLFYRDSRFFERRDAEGRKEFWSRGNGWVFAGMARILPLLPRHNADRVRMEALFQQMASRLKELQKPDGYWSPSLLAPEGSPRESSGTGFYTYGLAWGINNGLLPRAEYEPAVRRGWAALQRALQRDGRLGYVQQVSDRPEKVEAGDTQYYGVGAFLLAATQIAALDESVR